MIKMFLAPMFFTPKLLAPKFLLIALLATYISSCASINSVSLTAIPAKKGRKITSERSKMIFFMFNFDNDYINEMTNDLKAKCPDGQVQGILTKDETIMYFLFLLHKRRVIAEGYCQTNHISKVMKESSL